MEWLEAEAGAVSRAVKCPGLGMERQGQLRPAELLQKPSAKGAANSPEQLHCTPYPQSASLSDTVQQRTGFLQLLGCFGA